MAGSTCVNGADLPCYWSDGGKTILPSVGESYVTALKSSNGKIYALGRTTDTIATYSLWVDGTRTDIVSDLDGYALCVENLEVNGNDVWLCGELYVPESGRWGHDSCPSLWLNGVRQDLSKAGLDPGGDGYAGGNVVTAVEVEGGVVYAAGDSAIWIDGVPARLTPPPDGRNNQRERFRYDIYEIDFKDGEPRYWGIYDYNQFVLMKSDRTVIGDAWRFRPRASQVRDDTIFGSAFHIIDNVDGRRGIGILNTSSGEYGFYPFSLDLN